MTRGKDPVAPPRSERDRAYTVRTILQKPVGWGAAAVVAVSAACLIGPLAAQGASNPGGAPDGSGTPAAGAPIAQTPAPAPASTTSPRTTRSALHISD